MNVCPSILSRTARRLAVLTVLVLTAALLPFAVSAPALAASPQRGASGDPGGNNGTVKVQEVDFDSPPNNDPHVGCTFLVEWYGFDKGANIISNVKFEMQSPTSSVGLTVTGPSSVFVGGDDASGAGTPSGLDGRETYTLSFDGPPHPIQGYHVKLTVQTPGSKGNDKKYKVFWVKGCDPVQPPNPGINIEKSVTDSNDPGSDGQLGETLTYSFTVTNTGNVPLTNVTVNDPMLPPAFTCVSTLAAGATVTCPTTRTYVVTAADIANGSVHNKATVTGKPPTGPPVEDDDEVTLPTPPKPAIQLDKSVADSDDGGTTASVGETLTYTFKIKNTGNVPLTNLTISDPKLSLTNAPCSPAVASLAVGATVTCLVVPYVVTAADMAHSKIDNVATAKGKDPSGHEVTDDDDATIPTQGSPGTPGISIVKTVADANGDGIGSLGEVLTYTFTVTNTGTVSLTNVMISDPMFGSAFACMSPSTSTLAAGATVVCPTKQHTVSTADIAAGSIHNIATATGKPPTGGDVTDHDDVTIQTPALPRIHLEKSVADSSDSDTLASLGEVLTYTFKVTNTGNVPLNNVTIDDARLGLSGVFCVANLAVGASYTCPTQSYTVTSTDVGSPTIDNIATATGSPPSGPVVTDTDNATICTKAAQASIFLDKQVFDSADLGEDGSLGEVLTYTFDVTNTGTVPLTNITITDPMFGLSNALCFAGPLAPGATTNCPALPAQTHTVNATDVSNHHVYNEASVSGNPPTGDPVKDDDDADIHVTGGPEDVDLVVEKSSDVPVASPGDVVTYTINVRNAGPGDALNVVVTDVLPAGTQFVSASSTCTESSGTVTCNLGTIVSGDDATVTIKVKVTATVGSGGTTTHQHQLDYTKVESHLSVFDGDEVTGTTQCPTGYLATDGSVRLDHVDQGAGGFEDIDVLQSAVTTDGKGWTGTVRNNTTGQVQAKVMVVCMTKETTSGEGHTHPVVINGPDTETVTLTSRSNVELTCGPGEYPVRPSYVLTSGTAVVGTRRISGGWRFIVDPNGSVTGTFSIHCLSDTLGTTNGHNHTLVFQELSDTVTVPAGGTVERKLTCPDGYKGIVAWADTDPGLVSLGNDPQPIIRVFKFYNPTDGPLDADFGLLCVAIRTRGADGPADVVITNTAKAVTSSNESSLGNNSDSATFAVTSTGVTAAPKAVVVSDSGKTAVRVAMASSGKRSVTLKLLAAGRIGGTKLKAGSLLAQSKAQLRAGTGTVRLVAKGAAVRALRSGKVGKARLVIISHGRKSVVVIKLR